MDKKIFEISGIKSNEDLNALSIDLNEKEQVSHIKISKDSITFRCLDIDVLLSSIQKVDKELIVKEVIDGVKREYDFAKREEKMHYFMFKNMLNVDDVLLLVKRIEGDQRFAQVTYDQANQLLTLKSASRDVLAILRKELFKINPSMEIIEHRKPVRSQDVFNQKYMKTYLKIAILLVAFALAMITSKDDTLLTPVCWSVVVIVLSQSVWLKAFQHIRKFKFFHADVMMVIAFGLGIASGSYIETCLAVVCYQLALPITNHFLQRSLNRIDQTVQLPEKGICFKDGKEIEMSLYDFDIGDILVVHSHETIHMPGNIVFGESQLSTYSNTSQYDLIPVKIGDYVNSGDVNMGQDNIHIQITKVYESSQFTELMNIASLAPTYESKFEKLVKRLALLYTPFMFVLSIIVGIILPLVDFNEYGQYIHVGAFLMIISGALFNDQSTSLGMLAGFAKAFKEGIIVESSHGLDSINATQVIVYDRFDGVEVTDEELDLFKKLSHMGRTLVIFNDGPVALENDQYTIYNNLTVQEKLDLMDTLPGSVIYIGDCSKDIDLLQKSFVGVSRGGLSDLKVVESSDIVLIDATLDKVYQMFKIARKMRSVAILNNVITMLSKVILLLLTLSLVQLPLWFAVMLDVFIGALVVENSTRLLE